MTDYSFPVSGHQPANASVRQTQTMPTVGRGRSMETMLSFLQSPSRTQNNNEAFGTSKVDNSCNCERPLMSILCRSCGYLCRGRVQKRCPCHQDVIHLMDISLCPNCQANTLKEFSIAKPKK